MVENKLKEIVEKEDELIIDQKIEEQIKKERQKLTDKNKTDFTTEIKQQMNQYRRA